MRLQKRLFGFILVYYPIQHEYKSSKKRVFQKRCWRVLTQCLITQLYKLSLPSKMMSKPYTTGSRGMSIFSIKRAQKTCWTELMRWLLRFNTFTRNSITPTYGMLKALHSTHMRMNTTLNAFLEPGKRFSSRSSNGEILCKANVYSGCAEGPEQGNQLSPEQWQGCSLNKDN